MPEECSRRRKLEQDSNRTLLALLTPHSHLLAHHFFTFKRLCSKPTWSKGWKPNNNRRLEQQSKVAGAVHNNNRSQNRSSKVSRLGGEKAELAAAQGLMTRQIRLISRLMMIRSLD
ncbi:Sialidase [Actinidia chinensis var. chinensis]|uniref:Sialidase n=1 Tax=Actinidia chinensis var. chinensis TaxID=1590841 RepID=A0A2R6P7T9_ACTCC|nr:Sialidase [Actinidia chinensis var. chinensis]